MRRLTTVATVAVAVTVALVGATATIRAGHQFVPPAQRCNLATLHGAYGLQWIGTRPAPSNPAVIVRRYNNNSPATVSITPENIWYGSE